MVSSAEARRLAADEIGNLLDDQAGRVVVGITGPPGAGKSTFAERLVAELNADQELAADVPMDGFHL
ncbi:MAG: phosphoribulokinase/uridine kinase, partial [Mycobacterium sp.]|nr:phosphoribulokinase/uridine kinase [Mycobacterium sp.]